MRITNRTSRRSVWLIAPACLLALTSSAWSHHSVRAFYEDQTVRSLDGTVTRIRWVNPHIMFEIERTNDSGQRETWEVESGSINFLERDGINRDDIAVGDAVTVSGYTSRHGRNAMVASYVTLENGENVTLWPGLFGGGTDAGLTARGGDQA